MTVFIGIKGENDITNVFPARDYQTSAYETFMSNKFINKIDFMYPGNINFSLMKFNISGLKGNYSSFCVLHNENNQEHILSNELDKLKGFVGWTNRLTMNGGSRKIKLTKKKSYIKRKKNTKRK